jgi:hypothetical protein
MIARIENYAKHKNFFGVHLCIPPNFVGRLPFRRTATTKKFYAAD